MQKRLLVSALAIAAQLFSLSVLPHHARAIEPLSDRSINRAIQYGLENQEMGLSTFMGANWKDGPHGALLNVYTPFMEIARSAVHHNPGTTTTPTAEDIATARQNSIEDIDYIWHHPTVKFMVSMYGDSPDFARKYFAVIEGVGKGRKFRVYPTKRVPQYSADKEDNVATRPYAAINAYHFNFKDVLPLDEYTLKLYGKDVEPLNFKIINDRLL